MKTVICSYQGRVLDCRNRATVTIEIPDPDYPGTTDEVKVCRPCQAHHQSKVGGA